MNFSPEISILLPVYNCEKYIRIAIQSMLDQTFTNFELIILNDGSKDNSLAEIRKFTDDRIIVIDKENEGLAATLNRGIDLAKGKYIARMDQDDISMPDRLQKQYDYMEANPQVALTDTMVIKIDEESNEINKEYRPSFDNWNKYKNKFIRGTDIFHPTIMVRSEVLKKVKYNSKFYEDYFLFLELINKGYVFYKIPEYLVKYRILSTSMVNSALSDKSFMKKVIKTKQEYINTLKFTEYFKPFNIRVYFFMLMNKLKLALNK